MQMNMTTFKLLRYHVWELIGLPQGKRLIDSEWLYNIEHNAHGDVKYYNKICCKGFLSRRRDM